MLRKLGFDPKISGKEIIMPSRQALTDHDEQFIQRQVESGRYQDREEVIQAGIRMLEEFEEAHEHWLTEEIPGRYAELQRDPSQAIPFEDAFADFQALSRAELAKAK
jgi:antitoxin ParD1/3/4